MTLHPPSPRVTVVCLLLATLGLGGLLARPAPAADWTAEPAANQFGSGRQEYRYTANPSGQVEDGIVVANHGTAPLQVRLRTAGPRGLGAWLHPSRGDVTVQPGESAEVPFALTLPDDAAPGDYLGGIIASGADQRTELPVRLRVGGPLKPSLSAENVGVQYSDGDATVTYTVHNTGNTILTAKPAVSVSGPFGRWSAKASKLAATRPLLPGDSMKASAVVHDVTPALRLTATVTLVPLLTDAAGSTAPLAATKASGHGWAVPWLLLVAIVALVVASLALRLRPRQRVRT